MSLFGSLSGGVSGLLAQSESISVISDNLSNVNTIGFKNVRTLFDQQVTSSGLSGTLFNSGGVGTSFERFQNSQGAFLSTQSSTDLALSGNGFFTVVDDTEITSDTAFFYTRAGAFTENNRGFLTTPAGQNLLGWRTESDGTIIDVQNPAPVELQSVGSSARSTRSLSVGLNITSTENVHGYDTSANTLADEIDAVLVDPTISDFVTDIRFFDSQGSSRDTTMAFIKRGNNVWDWAMYTDKDNVITDMNGAAPTLDNALIGQGQVRFNTDGSLKFVTGDSLSIDWSGGVDNGSIDMNFGDYTGGFVFDPMPAGLQFADGVLDVSLDENDPNSPAITNGGYILSNLGPVAGGYNLQVQEPDGSIFTSVVSATATNRQVDFGNGVTMSLSASWDGTTWAGGVANMGTVPEQPKDIGRGTDGVIQFASPYNTLFANQDGFGSGTLAALSVNEEGFVLGSFTNGESKKLWKLTVAVFQDSAELEPVGENLLRETDGSGRPLFKEAGNGGTAKIVSGALEQSTVDIAQEFSNMIVAQRAFQASSTVITTVDQMLNELLQIR